MEISISHTHTHTHARARAHMHVFRIDITMKNQLLKVRSSNSLYLSPIARFETASLLKKHRESTSRFSFVDLSIYLTIESLFRVKVNFQTRIKLLTTYSFYSVITVAIFALFHTLFFL